MKIKQHLPTNNKSRGINSRRFIIIHHTATGEGSIRGVLRTLTVWAVSCHYVLDTNGDLYKIWADEDILWHCGVSRWGNIRAMNPHSIGIEVIWPLPNGFTFEQRKWVREIVQELMKLYNIPRQNVLRHADISPWRKVDIDLRFLNDSEGKPKYKSWKDWQDSL